MASIKILMRNKANREGLYPIVMRIVKDRKSKIINLGFNCTDQDWDSSSGKFKRSYSNYNLRNRVLLKLHEKALKIIDEFKVEEIDFTLEEFEAKFRGKKQSNLNVIDFFDEIMEEKERAGRMGSARADKGTKNALVRFKGTKIKFREITPAFLDKFEVHLRERGNTNGGISFKMRQLRAIYNMAIKRGIVKKEYYPFDDYKVAKLKVDSKKRALSKEELKKFRDVDLTLHPELKEAYDYFMFSFYTRGMNFVDIMKLKWSDIVNGRIRYQRSKTKGEFNVEVDENIGKILKKYKGVNPQTEYVFPILLHSDLTAKQKEDRRRKVHKRVNRKLKLIAGLAKIEGKVTTYVARHSFATIMKFNGKSIEVISELLGHSNVQITMTYLKDFDNEVLDEACRGILD